MIARQALLTTRQDKPAARPVPKDRRRVLQELRAVIFVKPASLCLQQDKKNACFVRKALLLTYQDNLFALIVLQEKFSPG